MLRPRISWAAVARPRPASHRRERSPGGVAARVPPSPRSNVLRGHRGRKKDVVMLEIGVDDSALVDVCDAMNKVKDYPLSERKREGS